MAAAPVRKKLLGCVRQENACLTMQNQQLITDLESAQYELASSKSKIRLLGSRVGVKSGNVSVLTEQILSLEAELEAQALELRAAELSLQEAEEVAAHSDSLVSQLTLELEDQRLELDTRTAVGKRAEQQRNQALHNAEKLKEAFKEYKETTSLKLKKVLESESRVKQSLVVCNGEKEDLKLRCSALEKKNAEQNQMFSQLSEEVRQARSLSSEHSDLQARLVEASRQTSHLERELGERAAQAPDRLRLFQELEEVRGTRHCLEQRLAQGLREAQQSQAELASLEAILALLHLREGPEGPLCVRPCLMPPVDYSVNGQLVNPKPGERYQLLLPVLRTLEAERGRQSDLVQRLQERLSRAQEEVSSLQASMVQRASHYQGLHNQLSEKTGRVTDTEKELKRKGARIAALEKQLQEKTSAYSQAALRNTELEQQLLEKSSSLQHHQSTVSRKHKDHQQAVDRLQQSHNQQTHQLQHQIEVLQLSVEEARYCKLQLQQELSSAQEERDEAQSGAALLAASMEELEKEAAFKRSEEALQYFKDHADQSATKQMEEVRENYLNDLQQRSNKIACLQEELRGTGLVCESSTQQTVQLQLSLQQQQAMLTESSARIAELEDSQSLLQKQVSGLEKELERARASLEEEARGREREAQDGQREVQEVRRQAEQLTETVGNLTTEMSKCRGQLSSAESELQRLRQEARSSGSHVDRLEHSLRCCEALLRQKTDLAEGLEEKLRHSEEDRRSSEQRAEELEGRLQAVRGELSSTLERLQELRDVLQATQCTADERQASLERLRLELRDTKRELEERTHEVLDMDTALKERQGELQQRAQLLGQLDVAIRDHRQEMEKKVEALQRSLDERESQLTEAQEELLKVRDRKGEAAECVCVQLGEREQNCGGLAAQLEASREQADRREELTLKEQHWLQTEARLQTLLGSLQQTRGQLLKVSEQITSTMRSSQEELGARLQQSQAQLEEARAHQQRSLARAAQLQAQLDQAAAQLGLTNAALDHKRDEARRLQAQVEQSQGQLLQVRAQAEQARARLDQAGAQNAEAEKEVEMAHETLLIKESEVTRLQVRMSSLERSSDLLSSATPTSPLPRYTLQPKLLQAPDTLTLAPPPSSLPPPLLPQRSHPPGQTSPQDPFASPHANRRPAPAIHPFLQPTRHPLTLDPATLSFQPSDPEKSSLDWLRSNSNDSSLDLPPELKATLRVALSQKPWESSVVLSKSPYPDPVDQSWQGLSSLESNTSTTNNTATDLSFNPLTYMLDKAEGPEDDEDEDGRPMREGAEKEGRESVCREEEQVEESEAHLGSLSGMLRFVNQTLAMQEDTSLWDTTQA
ncbi:hypothetical protein NHX12_004837 [Muraenolepis orangiensis]|uniref:Coiled-coil domain containing 18 n=1 Tax=Muraenolepis orangiensis TaxID=630683 RepID=A0A9Q0DTH3_9TELE|nr:hypothetical protein NHX12_004837 [Muraenolepis orangiensis]